MKRTIKLQKKKKEKEKRKEEDEKCVVNKKPHKQTNRR